MEQVLVIEHIYIYLSLVYGTGSQPFITVVTQVFRQYPPSSDDLTEISFFHLFMFFLHFLLFYKKSAAIFAFYVNSLHLIHIYYLCPHYVYVTQHFSVHVMYSLYGPHWFALAWPWFTEMRCEFVSVSFFIRLQITILAHKSLSTTNSIM